MLVKSDVLKTPDITNVMLENETIPVESVIKLNEGLFVVNMKNDKKNRILELVNSWNTREDVVYASEVLIDEKGNEIGGVTNQVFIRLNAKVDYDVLLQSLKPYNITVINPCTFDERTYTVTVNKNLGISSMQVANELFETGLFDYVEPNLVHFLKMSTNDTYFSQQWAINNTEQSGGTSGIDIKANQAWIITTGSSNVRIAILDVGVDLTHPDLHGNLLPGFDATGNNGNGSPLNNIAHGTACAGIAAAVGSNSEGIAGVAYGCRILPVSISNKTDYWTTTESGYIASGIDWARQNNASVISMSFGCIETAALNTEITEAATLGRNNLGCVLVAASGNSNLTTIDYPARNPNVIAVGAINNTGIRASFSNYGTNLDFVAPGENIYTTDIQGSIGYNTSNGTAGNYNSDFDGTSAACPHVSGIAALILSVRPDLTRAQVLQAIESTCTKLSTYSFSNNSSHPNGTWNNQVGHGLVNAYVAVNSVAPAISSISPSVVCSSGSSFSVSNLPPVDSIIWSVGPYLTLYSGQNTNSPTIKATGSGNSWVRVRFVNNYGNFILPQKTVWVGNPGIPTTTPSGYPTLEIGLGALQPVSLFKTPGFTGGTINWWSTGSIEPVGSTNSTTCTFEAVTLGTGNFYVTVQNTCGTSPAGGGTVNVVSGGGGQLMLVLAPNPATDETMITIATTEEQTVEENDEWDFEVFDNAQNLKAAKTKLKGNSTQLQTAGWKEGVYAVRVNYKQEGKPEEILTGKLVVTK